MISIDRVTFFIQPRTPPRFCTPSLAEKCLPHSISPFPFVVREGTFEARLLDFAASFCVLSRAPPGVVTGVRPSSRVRSLRISSDLLFPPVSSVQALTLWSCCLFFSPLRHSAVFPDSFPALPSDLRANSTRPYALRNCLNPHGSSPKPG